MKKNFLLPLFTLLFGFYTALASGPGPVDTIITLRNAALASGRQPAIIDNAGNNRGAAFNGKHVFVASRQNGNHVYYWDLKDTLAAPKELNLTGVSGGTFPLSDLAVVGDNLYLSNMVFAGGAFKVYHWEGLSSSPRVLLEYPSAPDRLGDAITVVGDPAKKALLIASSHGSKRFYIWTIEGGSVSNTTPVVKTYDFISNTNFGRITGVPGPEGLYLASAPSFGMMLLDSALNMVDTIGAAYFPAWAMHPLVFTYKNIRLLGYVHVRSSPAANALYVLNINDKPTVREAFASLRGAPFADRLLHSFNLGAVSNPNASAGLDVTADTLGNVQIMAFSAGNGFVVQQFGNERPYVASSLSPASLIMDKALARSKQPSVIDNAGNNRGAAFNGKYVFVASRQNGNHVYYWDVKDTLAAPKELNISGVTGGTFPLSDLAVVGDNLYLSNMVFAGGAFKVYHWEGLSSSPRVLLEFPAAPDRLGDAITVVGDPAKKAFLIASSHGNKRFYIWTIEGGVVSSTMPMVKTYDFISNANFGRITRVPGAEELYLASAPSFGMLLLDQNMNLVDSLSAAFFPSWPMHAQIFQYNGQRLMGYVHVKSSPIENALYIVDMNEKSNIRDAFSSLRKAGFAKRLLFSLNLGNSNNANASAGFDAVTDAAGNVQVMAFSAGNGFVVQQFGNKQVTSLPQVVEGGFELYPNPAFSEVQINAPDMIQEVLLFDFSGRQVAAWPTNGKQAIISVEQFLNGMYVLMIRSEKGRFASKLLIQK
jgi:hypothetical protein